MKKQRSVADPLRDKFYYNLRDQLVYQLSIKSHERLRRKLWYALSTNKWTLSVDFSERNDYNDVNYEET